MLTFLSAAFTLIFYLGGTLGTLQIMAFLAWMLYHAAETIIEYQLKTMGLILDWWTFRRLIKALGRAKVAAEVEKVRAYQCNP